MSPTERRVTWLGVGRMGEAMAERLLAAGVAVQAWNRTPGKLAGLLERGAMPLAAPALSETEVAFSMVLNDEALDRLWQAEDGILAGGRPPASGWTAPPCHRPPHSAQPGRPPHGAPPSSAPRSAATPRSSGPGT